MINHGDAGDQWKQEVATKAECMKKREISQHYIVFLNLQHLQYRRQIRYQIVMRQFNPFWDTS